MKRIPCALVGMLLLAVSSCAVTEPPRYATDHPASAQAPAAAAEPAPSALTTYRSFEGAGGSEQRAPENGHAHDHPH